jgi:hypothetical protein
MKVERHTIQACCGKKAIMFKTDQPITKQVLSSLINLGFKESEHFTKVGILYVDNLDFIMTAPFGADRLQIKCKKANCFENLNDLEDLLLKIG